MSNFNPIADEVMLAAFRRIGTIAGAAREVKVGFAKVSGALKRAGIVAPRGSHMHRVWATTRKGEVSKRRSGPAFVSSHLVHRWRGNASSREMAFELTDADMQGLWEAQRGKCYFTGLDLIAPKSDKDVEASRHSPRLVSLDRLDSSKHYVRGNVALVCMWVNLAKWKFSEEEFRQVLHEAAHSILKEG